MVTFSALLTLYAGNSPVTGEFPSQRPVTRSFNVFFDLRLNKRLCKQSGSRRFETPLRSLWRHYNAYRVRICSAPTLLQPGPGSAWAASPDPRIEWGASEWPWQGHHSIIDWGHVYPRVWPKKQNVMLEGLMILDWNDQMSRRFQCSLIRGNNFGITEFNFDFLKMKRWMMTHIFRFLKRLV